MSSRKADRFPELKSQKDINKECAGPFSRAVIKTSSAISSCVKNLRSTVQGLKP